MLHDRDYYEDGPQNIKADRSPEDDRMALMAEYNAMNSSINNLERDRAHVLETLNKCIERRRELQREIVAAVGMDEPTRGQVN